MMSMKHLIPAVLAVWLMLGGSALAGTIDLTWTGAERVEVAVAGLGTIQTYAGDFLLNAAGVSSLAPYLPAGPSFSALCVDLQHAATSPLAVGTWAWMCAQTQNAGNLAQHIMAPVPVPEPASSLTLFGLGLLSLSRYGRQRVHH